MDIEDALIAFAAGDSEIRVNFGMFAGLEELARELHTRVESFTIVSEHRYQFGNDVEASVHLVRVCPDGSVDDELRGRLLEICERWAHERVAERHTEVAEL